MTRKEILDAAKVCVCGDREEDYGTPEDNFGTIASFWSSYIWASHPGTHITFYPKDVAMMMALLKVARIATGENPDSFIDLAGYAGCAGEIVTN